MSDSDVVLLDFRALLEAAPDGIAVVDDQGRILVINDQMSNLFGYDTGELVGRPVEDLIPSRLHPAHLVDRTRYQSEPSRRPMGLGRDLLGLRRDGTEVPLEISLSPIRSGNRTFTIAVVRDIGDRRRLESDRSALQTILDTERERYRIGMDLHDGVMQDIYAVTLGLELISEDLEQDTQAAQDGIHKSIDQLHNVIRDVRSFIFDLRPRQFTGDVRQALIDLGNEFQENSGIPTEVTISADLPELNADLALALYLVTHEAFSNTRKHGHASRITVMLSSENNGVRLQVRDDGRGFDSSVELAEGHRGIRNLISRAQMVGATLRVESAPGAGTCIIVEAPLS
jgi:two-component system, NarL family, sensor histidine kinase DevS